MSYSTAGSSAMRAASVRRRRVAPERGRELMFGGVATNGVAPVNRIVASTRVQEACRVDRLYVTAQFGGTIVIPPAQYSLGDVRVGTKSQLVANAPLPAGAFTADDTFMVRGLRVDTLSAGISFSIYFDFDPVAAAWPANSVVRFVAFAVALR